MFRYSLILLLTFSVAEAADFKLKEKFKDHVYETSYNTVSFSYLSWNEKMSFDNGTTTESGYANLSGGGIHFERQNFWGRNGVNFEISVIAGQAAGGNPQAITATVPKVSFWAGEFAVTWDRRLTAPITFSLGPFGLYRKFDWTTNQPNLKITSGATWNYGLLAEMKLRLDRHWEIKQGIGTLAVNANTYWLLGLGYKF